MKNISIIGASGFIGRNLCSYLIKINEIFEGFSRSEANQNLKIKIVNDYSEVPKSKYLIYLAEESRVHAVESLGKSYIKNSLDSIRSIHNATQAKIIYISSSLVYGPASPTPWKVSDDLNLDSIYARSKAACEDYVLDNGGSVARLTNVYGPGMSKENVLSDILNQTDSSKGIILRNLYPIRDYVSIDDVVKCIHKIYIKDLNKIFNVGSGIALSVKQLAEIILKAKNTPDISITQTDLQPNESILVVDIEETKKELEWCPATEFNVQSVI